MPNPPILVQQIYLLVNGGNFTSKQGGNGWLRLTDVHCPQELQTLVESAGGGTEKVSLFEAGGAAEEGVALEAV